MEWSMEMMLKTNLRTRKRLWQQTCIWTNVQPSSEDEDVCPTYLDEYTKKIQKSNDMSCPHHFQLGCDNEWLAKNERWPICGRWKDLAESDVYDENRRVATMLEVANAKSCSWFNPKKG